MLRSIRLEALFFIAALLCIIPEHVPHAWPGILLWMPLMWHLFLDRFFSITILHSFYLGCWWGCLIYTGYNGGIMLGLSRMAHGSWYLKWVIPLLLLAYQALLSGLWFILIRLGIRCTQRSGLRLILCITSTEAYCIFIHRINFLLLGMHAGNPFFNPLRMLLIKPYLLTLLSPLGISGTLGIYMGAVGILYATYLYQTRIMLASALAYWLVLLSVCLSSSPPNHSPPPWLDKIAVIAHQFHARFEVTEVITAITQACQQILAARANTTTIFLPESSVYKINCPGEGALQLQQAFFNQHIPTHLLIGGFRRDQQVCRNSIWWYHQGVIQGICDKKHVLPLSETMPSVFRCALLRDLYFKDFDEIEAATAAYTVWECIPQTPCVIYICSELFFAWHAQDTYPNTLLVALCNDSWAPLFARKQMLRTAHMRALEWNRDILYITHTYCYYFAANGSETDLSHHIFYLR